MLGQDNMRLQFKKRLLPGSVLQETRRRSQGFFGPLRRDPIPHPDCANLFTLQTYGLIEVEIYAVDADTEKLDELTIYIIRGIMSTVLRPLCASQANSGLTSSLVSQAHIRLEVNSEPLFECRYTSTPRLQNSSVSTSSTS